MTRPSTRSSSRRRSASATDDWPAALAGERTTYERQLILPARPAIWIRVDYYPDRGSQGHVRGFLVTYSDIDREKRLDDEARRQMTSQATIIRRALAAHLKFEPEPERESLAAV